MASALDRSVLARIALAGFALLAAMALLATPARAGSIRPDLETQLAALPPGAKLPVIVVLEEQVDPAAAAAAAPAFQRRARGRAVVGALRGVAARTQPPRMAMLGQQQARGAVDRVIPFWVFNGVAVTATAPAIRALAARHDVREVRRDAKIPPPVPRPTSISTTAAEPSWHLEVIRAPEVWALGGGYTGAGVVIGSFDTGVDGTHPELAPRYRGDHAISWFDPYGEHASPYDNNGHGTHTVGTMVGGELSGYSIGVAPGARWIAAKGWSDAEDATESAFHQIFEWFLAPGGDPANAPDIVNSSWGMSPALCYNDFRADVQAFRAAGIVPVFASGNNGPDPGSVLAPGAYAESFTVGATDFDDTIAFFSGQGPSSCDGGVKPNVSAPGVFILSTFPGDSYAYLDGTSMATPQVSGAAALVLSIAPDMAVEEVEAVLLAGAIDLGPIGADNAFGYGRLDAMESAIIALESSGQPLIGVTATTPTALEVGPTPGAFRIRRSGATDAALTVSYTVSGTALPGVDYVALPGSITIPAGAASVDLAVTPIDDTLGELDESVIVRLTADPGYIAAPAQAAVTIVSDEVPPDLVVNAVGGPSSAGAGATITLTDTTRNQGAAPAIASVTRYFLSTDPTYDAADVLLASRPVPALAAGASSAGSVSATLPATTAAGTHWIIAKADGDDALVETDETNNLSTRTLQVGPDLGIASFSVPALGGAGETVVVSDTTRNWGAGAAGASTTSFLLSTDAIADAGDIVIGSRAVPALAAGTADSASTTLTIPPGTATGNYHVIARADSGEVVGELYEANNTMSRMLAVGADLQVSYLVAPSIAGAGGTITVTDTTRNFGGGPAAASTTRFLLSADPVLDAGDALLGSRAIPALAPGASNAAPVTVTLPAGIPAGMYYFFAAADGDGAVVETNEGNNARMAVIQVGADLTVSALTVPADGGAGLAITIAETTRNQGGGAAPASTTTFLLSADATLDASDAVLGSRAVAALAPGASEAGSTTVTIPAGTATGTYYVIARADSGALVAETYENNNTASRTVRVGPDLQVASIDSPASAGAGAAIAVTDTTRNAGGGAAPATTTHFFLSADHALDAGDAALGTRAVAALAPGASDTGTTTLTIPAGATAGTYWIIARADGGEALVETLENNNHASRVITIGTDLVVSSLTAPGTAGAGVAITIADSTRNTGGGGAGASTTSFYLSADTALDAGDVLLGSRAVGALAAGASSAGSTTVTIPAGTATGTHYVIARADSGEAVSELSETNNTASWSLVVGPDLVVDSLTVPASGGAGTTISVTDTTRNAGGGSSAATVTRFYLSANQQLDAGDAMLGLRAVPALAPAGASSGATSLAIPAGTAAGSYWIIARADGDDALAETHEGNNTLARGIVIGADLVVASLTVPADGGAGLAISVSDTTRNQSTSAAGASITRFYLSSDWVLDASDVALGSRAVAALAAGASDTGTTSLVIPAGTVTGAYYVIARADGDDAVSEIYENNNVASRSLRVGPDLTLSSLTAPTTAGAGATIAVADTTRNAGAGAAEATTTRFYLSANSSWDAGDALLGARAVPALAALATSSGSTPATIPAGTAPGTYWIIARADADGTLAETQETNNQLARTIQVGTDLAISSLSVPMTAAAGQSLTVSDTTRNQGAGPAEASTTTFYLSTDTTFGASDVVLGSRAVPLLASGATDTASTVVTIPAGTATGSYYVIARADAGEVVAELYETNNTMYRALAIGPDLRVTYVTAPSTAAAGATINVGDTTRNQGGGGAAESATRFVLSSNSVLDAADTVVGSRAVPALAAGASNVGTVAITIPAGTAAGTYYLFAVADGEGAVAETSEANNAMYAVIQVTVP
jgi:subtilase family serine protease